MFNAAGIILAGGESSRMNGADKALLVIDSQPMIEANVKLLQGCLREVIIVTNGRQLYDFNNVKVITDEQPGCGPLMGLYSGLKDSCCNLNFITACDMPFINLNILALLLDAARQYDVVVPIINGFPEPLMAIYHKRILPWVRKCLDQNRCQMVAFYNKVKVCEIPEERIRRADPDLKSFVNINTPRDLDRARRMIQQDNLNAHAG